jgi:hypothetical protein
MRHMSNFTFRPGFRRQCCGRERRRETAERLWNERLERRLLDEAEELERRAAALELEVAIDAEETNVADNTMQPAALREEGKRR